MNDRGVVEVTFIGPPVILTSRRA